MVRRARRAAPRLAVCTLLGGVPRAVCSILAGGYASASTNSLERGSLNMINVSEFDTEFSRAFAIVAKALMRSMDRANADVIYAGDDGIIIAAARRVGSKELEVRLKALNAVKVDG